MQHIEKSGDNSKNTDRPRSVYIATIGCQMNTRDSEVIKGLLLAQGHSFVEDEKQADVVLFNTCSVRRHAEDKVWSEIGRLASKPVSRLAGSTLTNNQQQATNGQLVNWRTGKPIIGLVGCMAQNYQKEIFRRAPRVDFIVGPADIAKIPEIIKKLSAIRYPLSLPDRQAGAKIRETDGGPRPDEVYHAGFYKDKNHAYVVISEGCDNFCSYCLVPYVRGRLRHRPPEAIIQEINGALTQGIRHITLLGQNVNSYGYASKSQRPSVTSKINFVKLLERISQIRGLESLSFITSHPKDISADLFELMSANPIIKKCLHLPIQSGSDRILGLMHRGYTAKKYLEIIDQYRSIVYNAVLGTDIIVGFPGETDEDFRLTFELVKQARFDCAYIFKYSPRPHTQAARMKDDVAEAVKKERHGRLLELQKGISREIDSKPALEFNSNAGLEL